MRKKIWLCLLLLVLVAGSMRVKDDKDESNKQGPIETTSVVDVDYLV